MNIRQRVKLYAVREFCFAGVRVCTSALSRVSNQSIAQPRQGRQNLARGASPWKTRYNGVSPGGATYDQERRAPNKSAVDWTTIANAASCRPSGALDDFSSRSRGLRPWLNYAAAPQLNNCARRRIAKQISTFSRLSFLVLLAFAAGCQKPAGDAPAATSTTKSQGRAVNVVRPERKTIRREVGQPGFIQAFEKTPIVSKIPGYVLKWNADIGDSIHKDDVLAELWVPEMVAELELKEEQVAQAEKLLAMAKAQVETARAQAQEAKAGIGRAEAASNYWKGQTARFASLVKESVLDKQTQEDTLNQYKSAAASLSEAKAKLESAQAVQQEKESAREKAEVDIRAAQAERRRQADLVAYATLTAPYEGIVTQRNINTKQFVQPATGAQPDTLYVVERTDIVRIFVSVPETDADWVRIGTPATVRVQALQGEEFKGNVTRTAWSLNRGDPHSADRN